MIKYRYKNWGDIIDSDTTILFYTSLVNEKIVYDTIKDVYESLEERGYNPINQIVGYIISGDLGYISSYKEARNKISKLDRNTIVEVLLKNYLK